MLIAGEGVANQNRVGAISVQPTIGFIGDLHAVQAAAGFQV